MKWQTSDAKRYYLNHNCFEKTKVRWGIFKKLSCTNVDLERVRPLATNTQINETPKQHEKTNLIFTPCAGQLLHRKPMFQDVSTNHQNGNDNQCYPTG